MCLRNVSGTVRVIKMTSANRLTASGCIASRWVYILIVNLLETPDGKFRDNMHTLTLVKIPDMGFLALEPALCLKC